MQEHNTVSQFKNHSPSWNTYLPRISKSSPTPLNTSVSYINLKDKDICILVTIDVLTAYRITQKHQAEVTSLTLVHVCVETLLCNSFTYLLES